MLMSGIVECVEPFLDNQKLVNQFYFSHYTHSSRKYKAIRAIITKIFPMANLSIVRLVRALALVHLNHFLAKKN